MWLEVRFGVLVISLIHLASCAKWAARNRLFNVRYGQDGFMLCNIEGSFVGIYDKNSRKIETGGRFTVKIEDSTKVVLDIKSVNEADYGDYKCGDSTSSDTALLEIDTVLKDVEAQSLAVGFDGKIKAEVLGNPRHPITWYRDGEVVAAVDEARTLTARKDERFSIEFHGSLVIKGVKLSDAGKYTILVFFLSAKENKSAIIDVGYKPAIDVKPDASYTRTKGLPLKLPCSFKHTDENPTWTFTNRSGAVTTIEASKVDASGYNIESISASDEGNYTCKATNKFGELESGTKIASVITPAEIITDFKDIKIPVDSKFQITCEATGIPPATVELFQGDKKIASGESSVNISASMKRQYTGAYRCVARNGATNGSGQSVEVKKSMTVTMLTPPKINRSIISIPITTALNYNYEFTCSARGNPAPRLGIEQDGRPVTTINNQQTSDPDSDEFIVTSTYKVETVSENDFGDLVCMVENSLGNDNITVPIKRVVKSPPPSGIQHDGNAGLTYIDLQWDAVPGVTKYIIYVNETRQEETTEKKIAVDKLLQNTLYSFTIASVNIAGVGNTSNPTIIRTSDIIPPGKVRNIKILDITYKSAEINWDVPENVDPPGKEALGLDIFYKVKHCPINNNTDEIYVDKCRNADMRDTSRTIKELESGTWYRVTVFGVNQNVNGESNSKNFSTKEYVEPQPPFKSRKNEGLSTGVIAGIIIVIIMAILLVVDIFCCFFNHCGFTHCCFETFCSSKQNKYMPTDTKEVDEKEMMRKSEEAENVV